MSDRAIRTEQVRWSDLEVGDVISLGVTRTNKQLWYEVGEVKVTDGGVTAKLHNGSGKGGHWSAKHGVYDLVTVQRFAGTTLRPGKG